jgi:hypothetical protein
MLVSGRMILKHSADAISEFFVEGSRLKTEGVQECIGAATLNRVKFRTHHQFLTKATPSHSRSHGKRSDVQPSPPNISEQNRPTLLHFQPSGRKRQDTNEPARFSQRL